MRCIDISFVDLNDEQCERITNSMLEEVCLLDWKQSTNKCFDSFDELLSPFKLEIVMFNMGDDTYYFMIAKKGVKTRTEKIIEKLKKK